jgi:hypothetical protein
MASEVFKFSGARALAHSMGQEVVDRAPQSI